MIGDDSFVIKRVPGDIAQPAEKDNQDISNCISSGTCTNYKFENKYFGNCKKLKHIH